MDVALTVNTDVDDDDDGELLEEALPEPSRTVSQDDLLRISELCETALEAQQEEGRQIGIVDRYNLGIIDLPAGCDDEAIEIPHYAPRRGAMIDLIGALAAGCPQHPQGPVGAVARALFIRFEHAEALETGWSCLHEDANNYFPEYDENLLRLAATLRRRYVPLAVARKAA